MLDGRIPVRRVCINFGVNNQGQIMGNTHVRVDGKELFVIPGKMAIIEMTKQGGGKTIIEMPLGPFGIEYDPLPV